MRFLLGCEISPPGIFGLPDGNVLVLPAPGGQVQGPVVHTQTGVQVRPGTLPTYRRADSIFQLNLTSPGLELRIRDNLLELKFEADDPSIALEVGLAEVDRFLQHVAVEDGRCLTALPLFLEDEHRQQLPLPKQLWRTTITVFDHSVLESEMRAAGARLGTTDPVLLKSTEYYQHALYLASIAPQPGVSPFGFRTAGHLLAAAFLFLWKALSAIVGDPSKDRGDYQSRYRQLGFDQEFFEKTIERIRQLRNDEDVAHYRLDAGGLETVRQKFARSKDAVRDVIRAYARYLSDSPPGESQSGQPGAADVT